MFSLALELEQQPKKKQKQKLESTSNRRKTNYIPFFLSFKPGQFVCSLNKCSLNVSYVLGTVLGSEVTA